MGCGSSTAKVDDSRNVASKQVEPGKDVAAANSADEVPSDEFILDSRCDLALAVTSAPGLTPASVDAASSCQPLPSALNRS
jgi:hypothetical protein